MRRNNNKKILSEQHSSKEIQAKAYPVKKGKHFLENKI